MALALSTFAGPALYLDAMILVGFLDQRSSWHPACRQLFRRALDTSHPVQLITATLTVDEVVFVLLQELLARPPYDVSRSRSQYLATHPLIVRELVALVSAPLDAMLQLVSLEPVRAEDITSMREEMAATGMLPRDAIHLAVARRLGIEAIASDDGVFEGRSGVTLYRP